ncbi:MAG TPA: TetR/AcrR family transcriptional regulator [Thermoanaerobaculia bacterium]|nr:TetR/AcrR family transcriptional regulator [Thermoanaerobaculia bacterium]
MATKGEATRAAILDQALAAASRLGLEALSIGHLAREVGMSKSGLFAHFHSKEQLQLEVLEEAVARFVDTVIAPALKEARGEPRVRALFDRWLEWEQAPFLPGGCVFIATANELDDRPGPVRDRLVAYQRDWIEALATAARLGVGEGHFREDLDGEQLAYDLYAIILAFHHFSRLMRDPRAEARARRAFSDLMGACRRPT